eukprot:CFRG5438T1
MHRAVHIPRAGAHRCCTLPLKLKPGKRYYTDDTKKPGTGSRLDELRRRLEAHRSSTGKSSDFMRPSNQTNRQSLSPTQSARRPSVLPPYTASQRSTLPPPPLSSSRPTLAQSPQPPPLFSRQPQPSIGLRPTPTYPHLVAAPPTDKPTDVHESTRRASVNIDKELLSTAKTFRAHKLYHVGQFYEWNQETTSESPDDEKRVKVAKDDIEWPKGMVDQFKLLGKSSVMIRQPTVEAMKHLENKELPENISKKLVIVLNGQRGTGKSTSISHVAQASVDRGWLVFHVPKATTFMYDAQRVVKSRVHPWFDQPFDWTDILNYFIRTNDNELMSKIKLKNTYEIEGVTVGPESQKDSLLDLARLGAGPLDLEILEDYPVAREVFPAVLDELRCVTEAPVLVAVDEFNALYNCTPLKDSKNRPLHGLHLATSQLLIRFLDDSHKLARGAVLVGLTNTGIRTNQKYGPEILKMIKEAQVVDPELEKSKHGTPALVKVQTRAFTDMEMSHFMHYHQACSGNINSPDITREMIDEVRMLSSCIPEQVAKLSVYM